MKFRDEADGLIDIVNIIITFLFIYYMLNRLTLKVYNIFQWNSDCKISWEWLRIDWEISENHSPR